MNVYEQGPPVIVVRVSKRRWKIARLVMATQVESGPIVVSYEVCPGLPYRREGSAIEDALLPLKRIADERERLL